jgi:hypothetical protein
MQTLAYRSGDVEKLVAIKSKDLSNSFAYLEIARIYKQAGDDEKALEWAEEGAWVFPGKGHPDLRRFLADEYHDTGRQCAVWAARQSSRSTWSFSTWSTNASGTS